MPHLLNKKNSATTPVQCMSNMWQWHFWFNIIKMWCAL